MLATRADSEYLVLISGGCSFLGLHNVAAYSNTTYRLPCSEKKEIHPVRTSRTSTKHHFLLPQGDMLCICIFHPTHLVPIVRIGERIC